MAENEQPPPPTRRRGSDPPLPVSPARLSTLRRFSRLGDGRGRASTKAHACAAPRDGHGACARARTHGTARNETRNNPARAALLSCGPIAPRRYRHTDGGMRGARGQEGGGQKGRETPRARHASKTAARGLSPAYLPTCIVAMSSRERSTRPVTTTFKADASLRHRCSPKCRCVREPSHGVLAVIEAASSCTEYLTLDA